MSDQHAGSGALSAQKSQAITQLPIEGALKGLSVSVDHSQTAPTIPTSLATADIATAGTPDATTNGSSSAPEPPVSSTTTKKWKDRLTTMTRLLFFASQGDAIEVQNLLDAGADVNATDYDGRSPLHLAASEGKLEVVQLLLDHGASVNPRDRWGHTPLNDAMRGLSQKKPEILGAHQYDLVIKLLRKKGALEGKAMANLQWELDPADIDFAKSKLIGKGAFGEIRKALWRGTPVAVKTILPALSGDQQILKEFRDEVLLLPKLNHPNVMQFLGYVTQSMPLMLITEYCTGGDLHDVLKRKGALPPARAISYALDVARGMNYLHNHRPEAIIHRDLKPRNLLRDEGDHLKVADFGLSKLVKAHALHEMYKMTGETGSYRYMAPEVFKHEAYDGSVDVYSFAVIFYEMFEGLPPFAKTMTPEGVAWKVAMEGVRPPFKAKTYPEGVKELIEMCWSESPQRRPSFMEIIQELEQIERTMLSPEASSPSTKFLS